MAAKRVTFRVVVTMAGNHTKQSAKEEMEKLLKLEPYRMQDGWVTVTQMDDHDGNNGK